MKKIIRILIIVLLVGFIPFVYAENLKDFTVRTYFSDDIDLTKIPSIYVLISVPGEVDYREIELTRENMFNYSTKDMPNDDIKFDSAYVAGDTYGKYGLSGDLKISLDNTATLIINVYAKGSTTTTSTTTTKAVSTSSNNSSDVVIVDDTTNITNTAKTTTTTATPDISDAAKARQELYKYIFIGLGVFVVVVIFIILVKIVRTNNLM